MPHTPASNLLIALEGSPPRAGAIPSETHGTSLSGSGVVRQTTSIDAALSAFLSHPAAVKPAGASIAPYSLDDFAGLGEGRYKACIARLVVALNKQL